MTMYLRFKSYRRLSLINGPSSDTQVLEAKPNFWHRVVTKTALDGEDHFTFPDLRDGEHGLRVSIVLRDSAAEFDGDEKDRIEFSDTLPPPDH
jgi:hypothetical protein